MVKIGLTGSIAVGKTTVCEMFRELGCHILDADHAAREVVAPGTPGLAKIAKEFGESILQPDGSLDRQKMGSLVFADESKRLLLNSIVHPLVIEYQTLWIEGIEAKEPDSIAIVDAALMIESGGYKRFDALIVIWCEPDVQLKRLMERDEISEADAERRIAAQMPQEEKKGFADYLIDTTDGIVSTRRQVTAVFEKLKGIELAH